MASEVRVTRNQRRGRIGELEIEARLSSFSNVMRPEYDVGIDYFCQLLEAKTAKYFCVQAKSTKRFDKHWSKGIKKEIIQLWLEQRFPVFLILYEESSENCYWISIEDNRQFLNTKLNTNVKTITLKIGRSHTLSRHLAENTEFIEKVKQDSIVLNALYGIPEMIGEGYVGTIPVLYLSDGARENIKARVRLGMDYLIYDRWLRGDLLQAYQLSKILAKFDYSHYDHFLLLARFCVRLGRTAEAKKNYNAAIDICKRDTRWNERKGPNDPSIEDIIEMIEKEKAKLTHNGHID